MAGNNPLQKRTILLLGKTGSGKSAVGNSILRKEAFESSPNAESVTSAILPAWAEIGGYELMVIDGPGLEDTNLNDLQDKERACKNLGLAMGLCKNGVHVFVFVIRYGERLTKENNSAIEALGKILGPKWLSHHGVIVMTHGNDWYDDMEDEERDITFTQWCKEENASYSRLFAKCDYRCVLFENRKPSKGQVQQQFQEIISFVERVKEKFGRYTNEHFQKAAESRDKLIVELKAPILQLEIQKSMSLLTDKCFKLSDGQSYEEKMKTIGAIVEKADILLRHLDKEDRGTGVLSNLKQNVINQKKRALKMEQNITPLDIAEMRRCAMQIEVIRTDSSIWKELAVAATSLILGGATLLALGFLTVATGGLAPLAIGVIGAVFSRWWN